MPAVVQHLSLNFLSKYINEFRGKLRHYPTGIALDVSVTKRLSASLSLIVVMLQQVSFPSRTGQCVPKSGMGDVAQDLGALPQGHAAEQVVVLPVAWGKAGIALALLPGSLKDFLR